MDNIGPLALVLIGGLTGLFTVIAAEMNGIKEFFKNSVKDVRVWALKIFTGFSATAVVVSSVTFADTDTIAIRKDIFGNQVITMGGVNFHAPIMPLSEDIHIEKYPTITIEGESITFAIDNVDRVHDILDSGMTTERYYTELYFEVKNVVELTVLEKHLRYDSNEVRLIVESILTNAGLPINLQTSLNKLYTSSLTEVQNLREQLTVVESISIPVENPLPKIDEVPPVEEVVETVVEEVKPVETVKEIVPVKIVEEIKPIEQPVEEVKEVIKQPVEKVIEPVVEQPVEKVEETVEKIEQPVDNVANDPLGSWEGLTAPELNIENSDDLEALTDGTFEGGVDPLSEGIGGDLGGDGLGGGLDSLDSIGGGLGDTIDNDITNGLGL